MSRMSSRPPGRAGRSVVLACEALEDRTVPTTLQANLASALSNHTTLQALASQGLQGSQAAFAAPLARADVAIQQQITQQVTQQLGLIGPALQKELSNLSTQQAQAVAPFIQEAQQLRTFAAAHPGLAQAIADRIIAVENQQSAAARATNMTRLQVLSAVQTQIAHLRSLLTNARSAINWDTALATRFQVGAGTPAAVKTSAGTLADPQLLTLQLNPLNINLLGLQVQTDQITVNVSAQPGSGLLLGNLLTTVANLVNLQGVNTALNNVLGNVVNLLNSAALNVTGVGSGSLSNAPVATTPVLDLYVAPVHLNLLGALVDTSPIHLTITAHSGPGLLLGNVVTDLANLFNPPLPKKLDLNYVNGKLQNLLNELNTQIPNIPAAATTPVTAANGQILSLEVPPINLNLAGLILTTSQIRVNANATSGNGDLLGNVLTTLLNTLDATPDQLATLSNNLNGLLAKVVGVLNASNLTLGSGAVGSLSPVFQTLGLPNLVNPSGTATAPVLNLAIASTDGTTPPVDVNLLGLNITTSNIQAQLSAQTGTGQLLGNLVYNIAHLLDPGGTINLLGILNQLAL